MFLHEAASKVLLLALLGLFLSSPCVYSIDARATVAKPRAFGRQRISINDGWKFWRSETNPDGLIYDYRPELEGVQDATVLKPWILPSANDFINDPAQQHQRPAGNPGGNVTFVQSSFNDTSWETVTLPHDWAIKGPFYAGDDPVVGGGMGRLPVNGVGWYRRTLSLSAADEEKSIYLEVDGAMSYAVVWLNGKLVGGWPYPYNSFRLDLTPHVRLDGENILAIRVDNPNDSARWYPGAGIYRNVWLTKVEKVHVGQYGTYIWSREVSAESAVVDLVVEVENGANCSQQVDAVTDVYILNATTGHAGDKVATFSPSTVIVPANQKTRSMSSVVVENPRLWGPAPKQDQNLYVAFTRLYTNKIITDTYETRFGIRSLTYDPNQGLLVNNQHISIQGVNQHHDLGALGAAFNIRAAERQLEILRDMGANAIRMSHNPPAPELLDLSDRMGFLVMDEIFDCWERNKTVNDFHLIFTDWHEPDLRSFLRRDRNHPSIVSWSYGNEVGEQYTNETGAALSSKLRAMVEEEDPTRHSSASINYATPGTPFADAVEMISLNYQGAGTRDTPAYAGTFPGTITPPLYPAYHSTYPEKLIFSSESASALSTRGTYLFPVTNETSAPINDTSGGNSVLQQVSAYELYSANFGSSADKVFVSQDLNPYAAGEFVWTGWDYIGEPTPYHTARSSYSGIIDLAGFHKDRFYLYQARWRPGLRVAHILPHWTWPERAGEVTPVHVFSAADEAELFLNGHSLGKKKRGPYEYRFRWDDVIYQPGELRVVTHKNDSFWANATLQTVGDASRLRLTADRDTIDGDGKDLSFVTVEVLDGEGSLVPRAHNTIVFSVDGPGEIVATDNGDPADMVAFPSLQRKAYSGLALAIVRAVPETAGSITVSAVSEGLDGAQLLVKARE